MGGADQIPEYINPNNHAVFLAGPDGRQIKIIPQQKMVLSDFFERYCVRGFIRRISNQPISSQIRPLQMRKPTAMHPHKAGSTSKPVPQSAPRPKTIAARIVGRVVPGNANDFFQQSLLLGYPISNNVGVGILSYNRPRSLKRLIDSIRQYTDLNSTTVFVSDDGSTDRDLIDFLIELEQTGDVVVLRNQSRIGVAGNGNRLLRCLSRFRHMLLLNDDVQITSSGWEEFYPAAAATTGLMHFCMHQPGIYGSRQGAQTKINGADLTVIYERPQGAVLYIDVNAFEKIGYFDESFGVYGMEHVDWSNRMQTIQGNGFYDVVGSNRHFLIHQDKSAVEDRVAKLGEAKKRFEAIDRSNSQYVSPSDRSVVPAVTYIIPCRDVDRTGAIKTVVANVRAQRFPQIQIVVVEHDSESKVSADVQPATLKLVRSNDVLFNKAMAFNAGAAMAIHPCLVLHDADMLAVGAYTSVTFSVLGKCDACHLGKSVIYTSKDGGSQIANSNCVSETVSCERVVDYFEGGSLACRRKTYWLVGGFNEDFRGYGCEDCDFYMRLSNNCVWCGDRSFNFLHLWHLRIEGWHGHHERNKEIFRRINKLPMPTRVADQCAKLIAAGYGRFLAAAQTGQL